MDHVITIPTRDGKDILVDAADYETLQYFPWRVRKIRNVWYAHTSYRLDCKRHRLFIHQMILGEKEGFVIDHINGDGLDNRRCNLRHATRSENAYNRHAPREPKPSKQPKPRRNAAKGVYWHSRKNRWIVHLRRNKQRVWIGSFLTHEEAVAAHQAALIAHEA